MSVEFQTVAVFGKRDSTDFAPLKQLRDFLIRHGRNVILEKRAAEALGLDCGRTLEEIGTQADLFIIYGGDGTFLGISRRMAKYEVPFIGINAGRLGFITDIPSERMENELSEILSGHYYTDSRTLLECIQMRGDKEVYRNVALNEVVISRGVSGGMVECSVIVNRLQMCSMHADGLIVSTPTGSTAYALSAGGPMIYPSVPCMLMIPVAPHTLSNRPIVLPESSLIEICVTQIRDAILYFDMQDQNEVLINDVLKISPYKHTIKILHPTSHNYFDTLNQKLHWNYNPTDR